MGREDTYSFSTHPPLRMTPLPAPVLFRIYSDAGVVKEHLKYVHKIKCA